MNDIETAIYSDKGFSKKEQETLWTIARTAAVQSAKIECEDLGSFNFLFRWFKYQDDRLFSFVFQADERRYGGTITFKGAAKKTEPKPNERSIKRRVRK